LLSDLSSGSAVVESSWTVGWCAFIELDSDACGEGEWWVGGVAGVSLVRRVGVVVSDVLYFFGHW